MLNPYSRRIENSPTGDTTEYRNVNAWEEPTKEEREARRIRAMLEELKLKEQYDIAAYQRQQAGTSQNPGMYYQQLASRNGQLAQQQSIEDRVQRMLMQEQQMRLIGAQAATEGIKHSEEWTGGVNLLSPGRMSHPFMQSAGGGGGGKGGGGGGVPEMSFADEEARRNKSLAEAAMYDSMVSGDTYVGPGAGWGATYSSPSYDLSTSSYGPSSGSGSGGSW